MSHRYVPSEYTRVFYTHMVQVLLTRWFLKTGHPADPLFKFDLESIDDWSRFRDLLQQGVNRVVDRERHQLDRLRSYVSDMRRDMQPAPPPYDDSPVVNAVEAPPLVGHAG